MHLRIGPVLCLMGALASACGSAQTAAPQPDKDGYYLPFGGVKPPRLVQAAPAIVPAELRSARTDRVCALIVAVDADGTPAKIEVANRDKSPLDEAAIAAVRQAQFDPGTLHGKPVPVRVFVWVPFLGPDHSPTPVSGPLNRIRDMAIPKVVSSVEAQFSDEARRKGFSGSLIVFLVVDEAGAPKQVRVVTPLGMGLDEQAVSAVRKYRFEPATLEGIPVPVPIPIEISFHLGSRY